MDAKRLRASFIISDEKAYNEFKIMCIRNKTDVSKELNNYIIKFVEDNK